MGSPLLVVYKLKMVFIHLRDLHPVKADDYRDVILCPGIVRKSVPLCVAPFFIVYAGAYWVKDEVTVVLLSCFPCIRDHL